MIRNSADTDRFLIFASWMRSAASCFPVESNQVKRWRNYCRCFSNPLYTLNNCSADSADLTQNRNAFWALDETKYIFENNSPLWLLEVLCSVIWHWVHQMTTITYHTCLARWHSLNGQSDLEIQEICLFYSILPPPFIPNEKWYPFHPPGMPEDLRKLITFSWLTAPQPFCSPP